MRTQILPRYCATSCARVREKYEEAKAKAGALDFLDLLLKARNLVSETMGMCDGAFSSASSACLSTNFRIPIRCRPKSCCCWPPTIRRAATGGRSGPIPGKLFIVGDPKQSIYRFRRADVGIYRDVYEMLEAAGAKPVTLRTSFRARPNIQRTINASFEPVMTGDHDSSPGQLRFARAIPARLAGTAIGGGASSPGAVRQTADRQHVDRESLPDAVGAFVDWLIHESEWKVAERPMEGSASRLRRPGADDIAPPVGRSVSSRARRSTSSRSRRRHICLLFRRFVSFGEDMTRPYVRALEARGIPHLLVGGRSFHNRGEIETLRAALAAIEWPDDELSVFATLRGDVVCDRR